MSGDLVFALPEPEFLWVFNMVGLRMTGASATVVDDGEGEWHHSAASAVPLPFVGYVTAPNSREIDRANARGVVLDAVALAPLATDIQQGDWLDCTRDTNIPASVAHTFEVTLARPNLSHIRLLLTRAAAPAPYPD